VGDHPTQVRRRLVPDLAQLQIILGSLLGHARIEGPPGARRLAIFDSADRAGYVWWKYERLGQFVDVPPRSCDGIVEFRTIPHPLFDDLAALVEQRDIPDLLTSLGRAVWLTDSHAQWISEDDASEGLLIRVN
jgi:hypothetical protein